MPRQNIYKIAIDSISAHVAILDANGTILETNRAWKEFASANDYAGPHDWTGLNYLKICDIAASKPTDEAAIVAKGIRQVVAGEIEEFFINYPCHSPQEKRWFALRVVRFREPGTQKVILTHENITPLVQIQNTLVKKENELREKSVKLEESNIALKVLLKHREEDRRQLENRMLANVRTLVLPYVEKLSDIPLQARERTIVEIIEERLLEIISPFLNRLTSLHSILTPQEIQVASLVKEGRTSKEIAELLMLSVSAIDFHRKNIRKKLNMTGKEQNLRSYLMSLQ